MVDPVRDFLVLLGISIIGIILIIFRRKGYGNPYIIDSLELLILIMIPVSSSMFLFSEPKGNLYWWLVVYFIGAVLWFIVGVTLVTKKETNQRLIREHDFNITILWAGLILIGIITYWLFLNVIPIFVQVAQG